MRVKGCNSYGKNTFRLPNPRLSTAVDLDFSVHGKFFVLIESGVTFHLLLYKVSLAL